MLRNLHSAKPPVRLKFQVTPALALLIKKDGNAANISILQPLSAGLDAKAVHAVQTWKFILPKKRGDRHQ